MKLSNYFLILLAGLFLLAFAGLNGCKTPEQDQEEEPVIDDEVTEPSGLQ